MVIRNGSKRTISASSGLELLQMVSKSDTEWCASKDAGLKRVDCEIPHRLERRMRLTVIRNGSKWTISASNGLELLQMVSKPNTEWCTSEDAGSKGVDCEIPRQLERRIKHFL